MYARTVSEKNKIRKDDMRICTLKAHETSKCLGIFLIELQGMLKVKNQTFHDEEPAKPG